MSGFLSMVGVQVFLGTLPLLGPIIWGLVGNDRRLGRMESQLDRIEGRVDRMEARLDTSAERLAKVEGKIEGGWVVVER